MAAGKSRSSATASKGTQEKKDEAHNCKLQLPTSGIWKLDFQLPEVGSRKLDVGSPTSGSRKLGVGSWIPTSGSWKLGSRKPVRAATRKGGARREGAFFPSTLPPLVFLSQRYFAPPSFARLFHFGWRILFVTRSLAGNKRTRGHETPSSPLPFILFPASGVSFLHKKTKIRRRRGGAQSRGAFFPPIVK